MELKKIDIDLEHEVNKCPICGHDKIKEFVLASCDNQQLPPVPAMEDPLHYWQCKGCYHVFMNPTYTSLTEQGIYSSGFYREVTYNQGPTLFEFRKEQIRSITMHASIRTFMDMKLFYVTKHLDVGAGMGSLCVEMVLAGQGEIKSYPCDVDPISLDLYKLSKLPTFSSLKEAQKEAPYDFVTAIHFLEHPVEPIPIIKEINAMMAPSATMMIVVPNIFDAKKMSRFALWHPHVYTEESMKRLAKIGGFEVYKLGFFGPKEEAQDMWALLRKE